MAKDQTHTHSSSRTAGGDPIEGADPGGTRSTKPGQRDKTAPKASDPKTEQTVQTGDRNETTESRGSHPRGSQ
jgi:hypothetical protein